MADLSFTPVAGRVAPQPGTSLAEMLNLASGIQQYQQAQQMNPLTLEAQRLAVQQAQAVNPLLQRQQQVATRVAEETATPKIQQQAAQTATAQTEAQRAAFALSGAQFDAVSQIAGSLATDKRIQPGSKPEERFQAIMEAFGAMKRRGLTEEQAIYHASPYITMAQSAPDQLPQALENVVKTAAGAQSQLGLQTPQLVTTPGGAPGTYVPGRGQLGQPTFTAPGQPIIEPTGQTDLNNNPIANVRDPITNRIIGQTTIPAGVPATRAMPAPARMAPGESPETYKAAQDLRMQATNAAAGVPMQQFNNNQIIALADKAATGRGAEVLRNLTGGYAALPFSSDMASNFDKLGHYMALQTGTLASSAGLATDAARALASEQSGKTSWTADALKSTARVNRALTTGTELFARGVENAFQKTQDPIAARNFQAQWARTTDINALRLLDAVKNKDNAGIKEVVDELGGPNSDRYKAIRAKVDQIRKLAEGQ